jgi:hypothetical protein
MDYALPTSWGQGSRGFWTKRKKSATSLLAIMALIAGIAVAFKLFDQTVPNNVVRDASIFDFDVWVQRSANQGCTAPVSGGTYCDALDPANPNPIFPPTETVGGVERPKSMFPGDSQTENVRIVNTNQNPAKHASFQMWITNIVVERCPDADGSFAATGVWTTSGDFDQTTGACLNDAAPVAVAVGDPDFNRFVNFFTLTVDKQGVYIIDGVIVELSYEDSSGFGSSEACSGGLKEITKQSPCDLGMVRARGSTDSFDSALDDRDYEFTMSEADDGSDQSKFKGWRVVFDMTFAARVPGLDDATTIP